MKYSFFILGIGFLIMSCTPIANDLIRFTVSSDENAAVAQPIEITIDDIYSMGVKEDVALFQIQGDNQVSIPYQIDTLQGKRLLFIHQPSTDSAEEMIYALRKMPKGTVQKTGNLSYAKEDGNLTLYNGSKKPVLSYRYEMNYPPDGADSLFKKSGFIHPLWSPSGDTLTRINPPDHYHHYGIWGPWTKTKINDRAVDFWNLGEGQGTVLFDSFKNFSEGPVFTAFTATQNHLDYGAENPANKVALKEELELKVWNISDTKYVIDYTSTLNTPLESGILFEAYRYGGGIGIRATEKWHTDNSSVLTSEGKDRLTADGSNAKWCIINGASSSSSGKSGIMFMSHPENRAHPEPMRVWPSDWYDGKSNMFFEFSPIRDTDWLIEPNKTYQLKYRMLVFDGELGPEEAEAEWRSFANTPKISIETTAKK